MGSRKRVEAVVVGRVWERRQFVEELLDVASPNDLEEAVLGRGGDRLGAHVLGAGDTLADDAVAAQEMSGIAVGECHAGRARLLFDSDRDVAAVARRGLGDQALDRARCLALGPSRRRTPSPAAAPGRRRVPRRR